MYIFAYTYHEISTSLGTGICMVIHSLSHVAYHVIKHCAYKHAFTFYFYSCIHISI